VERRAFETVFLHPIDSCLENIFPVVVETEDEAPVYLDAVAMQHLHATGVVLGARALLPGIGNVVVLQRLESDEDTRTTGQGHLAHQRPRVVGTTAKTTPGALSLGELAGELATDERPTALLFGTGWGLVEAEIAKCDQVVMPIAGLTDYNHLSVRSAVCAILDRLFGLRAGRRAEPTP